MKKILFILAACVITSMSYANYTCPTPEAINQQYPNGMPNNQTPYDAGYAIFYSQGGTTAPLTYFDRVAIEGDGFMLFCQYGISGKSTGIQMLAWGPNDPNKQIVPAGEHWIIGPDAKCGSDGVSVPVNYCEFNIIPK
ncbi:MAG: hypothetical protein JO131_04025 [Gammaproteobacteria bacterium]|nr:hypothetical protein [Gammaproteobacteria bacterium]